MGVLGKVKLFAKFQHRRLVALYILKFYEIAVGFPLYVLQNGVLGVWRVKMWKILCS